MFLGSFHAHKHMCGVFLKGLHHLSLTIGRLQGMHSTVLKLLLNDLPGLLFFTTYTLLVLFWAEIYHQARSHPTSHLRPAFLYTNVFVYAMQVGLLCLCGLKSLQGNASVRLFSSVCNNLQVPSTDYFSVSYRRCCVRACMQLCGQARRFGVRMR
jgi:hypothetical protein